jgi:hypothetical protein
MLVEKGKSKAEREKEHAEFDQKYKEDLISRWNAGNLKAFKDTIHKRR